MSSEISASAVLRIARNKEEREEVMTLLKEQKLPVSDITENTLLYVLRDGETVIGTAGLDIFNGCTLLRSIGILKDFRGKGYGELLNSKIEQAAKEKGINCLYLVTDSAGDFFSKQGYFAIDRNTAPEGIKQTDQFSSLCPSSALVMKKYL